LEKIKKENRFIDFSDYARPIANLIVRILLNTKITSNQITFLYFLTGILTGFLIIKGKFILSAVLILVKNILDAVDGSLARARQRPSRVGRFFDSVSDILLNAVYVFSIAIHYSGYYSLAFFTLLSMSIQGSFYNYYYVMYRHKKHGDRTSLVYEKPEGYPWDNPRILKVLFLLYRIFYFWQDRFVEFVDKKIVKREKIYANKNFLMFITFMGLGIHLLVLSISLFISKPLYALFIISLPMNVYLFLIIFIISRFI